MIDPVADAANQLAYWAACLDTDFAYAGQGEIDLEAIRHDLMSYEDACYAWLRAIP